jgi:hypothetical protein
MIRIVRKAIDQISQITEGVRNTIFTTPEVEEVFDQRMKICEGCEFAVRDQDGKVVKCGKCGCKSEFKLRSLSSSCPLGKWESLSK